MVDCLSREAPVELIVTHNNNEHPIFKLQKRNCTHSSQQVRISHFTVHLWHVDRDGFLQKVAKPWKPDPRTRPAPNFRQWCNLTRVPCSPTVGTAFSQCLNTQMPELFANVGDDRVWVAERSAGLHSENNPSATRSNRATCRSLLSQNNVNTRKPPVQDF